jgi:hypothetical protein
VVTSLVHAVVLVAHGHENTGRLRKTIAARKTSMIRNVAKPGLSVDWFI